MDDTFAQWIMAFFTIAVVALVWQTLVATQRISKDTTKTVDITREIGRKQTRAYITMKSASPIDFFSEKSPRVSLPFVNTGQTPARKVVLAYNLDFFEVGQKPPRICLRSRHASSASDLGPNDEKPMQVDGIKSLSDDQWGVLKSGKALIRAYGYIRYYDVFGKRHFTTFCYTAFVKDGDTIMVQPAYHHNRGS